MGDEHEPALGAFGGICVGPFGGVDAGRLLLSAMKTAEVQHRVLANNIANVDTPHFNPTHLDFAKALKAEVEGRSGVALRASRPRHFDLTVPGPQFERLAILSKNDYNKVDLDEQLAALSENTGRYTVYARLLTKRFEVNKTMLQSLAR
jgi:flagellar basal-body rod protein FlgB